MKYTILDMTQTILSSMDSDEVNSINDTVESQQVSKVLKTVYFDLVNRANLPEQFTLFQLEPSDDNTKPTLMYLPDTVQNVTSLKYDAMMVSDDTSRMTEVMPLPLDTFLNEMDQMNTTEDNVGSFQHLIGDSLITFVYRNDTAPFFYTTFDDGTIIFNSYDSAMDTTLQKIKSRGWGKKNIPWVMDDNFIPDLDDNQFPILLNEAKELCFLEAKQAPHPLAERGARRSWVSMQKQKTKVPLSSDLDNLPYFGRK